ncbi:MAG: hypothetical protein HC888_01380 [Candidatus Competibacteraceae bacterium]|nr:hypothetical protein [Candidatus Competibacteraceae bacterium]
MIKFYFPQASGNRDATKNVKFVVEGLRPSSAVLVIENGTYKREVLRRDIPVGSTKIEGEIDLLVPDNSPQTAITCFVTAFEKRADGTDKPLDMSSAVFVLDGVTPSTDYKVTIYPQYIGPFETASVGIEAHPNKRYALSIGSKRFFVQTDASGKGTYTVQAADIAPNRSVGVVQRLGVDVYNDADNYANPQTAGAYVHVLPARVAKLIDCDPWEPDADCLAPPPSQLSMRSEKPGPEFPAAIAAAGSCEATDLFTNKVCRVEDCSAALLPNGHFVYSFVGPNSTAGSSAEPLVWVGSSATAYARRSLPMRFGVVPPSETEFLLYVEKEVYDKITSPTTWEVQIRHADFGFKKFPVVSRHAPDPTIAAYRLKLDLTGFVGGIDSWYLCVPYVLFAETANASTLGLAAGNVESLPAPTDFLGRKVAATKASIATCRAALAANEVSYVYVIASCLVDGISQLLLYAFTVKAGSATGSYTKETFEWKQITSIGENKNPRAVCDDAGNLHIFWESDRSGSTQIYYSVLGPQAYSLANAALSSAIDKQADALAKQTSWTCVTEKLFAEIQPPQPLDIPQFCEDLSPEYLANNLWMRWTTGAGFANISDNQSIEVSGNPAENSAIAFSQIDRNIDGSYLDGRFQQRGFALSFSLEDMDDLSPMDEHEVDAAYSVWKSNYIPYRDAASNGRHLYIRNGNKMAVSRTDRYFDRLIPIAGAYKNQLLGSLFERCFTEIEREFSVVASGCNATLRHFMLTLMPEKVRFKATNIQSYAEYCGDGGLASVDCEADYIAEEEATLYTGRYKLAVLLRSDGRFFGSRSPSGFTLVREVGEPFSLDQLQRFNICVHYRKMFFEDNAIWSGASVAATHVNEPKYVASIAIAMNDTPKFAESFLVDLTDLYRSFDIGIGFPGGGQYITRENLPYQSVVYDDRYVHLSYSDVTFGPPGWSLAGNMVTMPEDCRFFEALNVPDTLTEAFASKFADRYSYLDFGIEGNGIPEIPLTFEGINKNVSVALGNFCNDIHIAWQSNRDKHWDIYYASTAQKLIPFRNETRITKTKSNSIMPSLSLDGDGNRLIAWSDNRDGRFQIYAAKAGPTDGACSFVDCELYSGVRIDGAVDISPDEGYVNTCSLSFEFCNEPCDYDINIFDPCSTLSWCDPPSTVGGEVNGGVPITLKNWVNTGISHDNDEDNAVYCSRLFVWKCAKHDGVRYDFSDSSPSY